MAKKKKGVTSGRVPRKKNGKKKLTGGPRRSARKAGIADRIGRLAFTGPEALSVDQKTCAGHVFGETSVLSNNADKLKDGRRFIAGVAYKRNGAGMAPPVIPSDDDLKNPNTKAIWDRCMTAAKDAATDDVGTCKHFVIWFSDDDGKTPSRTPEEIPNSWPYDQADKIKGSWGPFTSPIKPKGTNIFIIKYCGVP